MLYAKNSVYPIVKTQLQSSLRMQKSIVTKRSCCASCRSLWSRWSTCVSSFDCVLVERI